MARKYFLIIAGFVWIITAYGINPLAKDYQEVNPKKLSAERSTYDGKDVWFKDKFSGVVPSDIARFDRFGSEMKNYVIFRTAQAGNCMIKKGETDTLYKLEQGQEIIVYAEVRIWNPGYGPRYDVFVNKIQKVEKKDADAAKKKVKIVLRMDGKTVELEEGVEKLVDAPSGIDKLKVSFELSK